MNYTTLVETIKSTTENYDPDFATQIPDFVQRAERRIYNSVHLLALRKNVLSEFTAGKPYLRLPSDFLAVYSFAVVDDSGKYHYLIDKDVSFIREAFSDPSQTGIPTHYGLFEDCTMIVGPMPDKNYKVEMHHFYYPQSIVTAGTSWLGDNYEAVLIYAALVHANVFMKGSAELTASYDKQFTENLALLKRLGDGMNRQDTYRSGQVVLPVT